MLAPKGMVQIVHTAVVDKDRLDRLAALLGIQDQDRAKLKPGKIHIVQNESDVSAEAGGKKP